MASMITVRKKNQAVTGYALRSAFSKRGPKAEKQTNPIVLIAKSANRKARNVGRSSSQLTCFACPHANASSICNLIVN